ncbi:MAG TPA: NAD+ synthase [Actinomycetota bacterium]|nr:NAD+ synthase [Actinomycetota bacterium]
MRIALAQVNPTVGDIDGNIAIAVDSIRRAGLEGAQVIALPELMVTGYPPEDLLFKPSFVRANRVALEDIAAEAHDVLAVVGFVDASNHRLYNAAAVCFHGEVVSVYHKHMLPNYGVFDERRYFTPGRRHVLLDAPDVTLGVCVCEDAWFADGPAVVQGDAGAQVIVNINASPFHRGKLGERIQMLAERARRAAASIVYVNSVGGQDELVFDGGSLVLDAGGDVVAQLPQFEEDLCIVDVPLGTAGKSHDPLVTRIPLELRRADHLAADPPFATLPRGPEEIYRALELGLRDYVRKNGFTDVVIGLSGGIDSSLTAAIAVDALGAEHVTGIAMPSENSSAHSVSDALALADALEITCHEVPIKQPYEAFVAMVDDVFGAAAPGLAEENIQARIRGNLLMFISNRYGHLVVVTGNKSEMAVGFSTLYGDMAGGFAVLKDVLKRDVYALARWRNSVSPVISEGVLTKPPSAELRPGQRDEDSLPPYEVLDSILEAYVERDASMSDILAQGFDGDVVEEVIRLVDRSEYKRRQAPPGIKVTAKAFGRDRRLPITNRWRDSQYTDGAE